MQFLVQAYDGPDMLEKLCNSINAAGAGACDVN